MLRLLAVLALGICAPACQHGHAGTKESALGNPGIPATSNDPGWSGDGAKYKDPGQVAKTRNAFQSFHY